MRVYSDGNDGMMWLDDQCTCTICHLIRRILAYSLDLSVSRDGLSGHRGTF